MAFDLLSHVLTSIPAGVANAIWQGLGVVLIALAARLLQGQRPTLAMIGMALVVANVVVLKVSKRAAYRSFCALGHIVMAKALLPSIHRSAVLRRKELELKMTKFYALVAALAVFAPTAYATVWQAAQITAV